MKLLQTIILILILSACSTESENKEILKKKNGLPDKAFWIGGVDGGNWYYVHEVHPHVNNAYISIYDDNGSLLIKKKFFVICNLNRPVVWIDNLETQITGFDGEKIILKSPTGKEICWMQ
jgi:hypothetical protein